VVDDARFQMLYDRRMAGERGGREPTQLLDSEFSSSVKDLVGDQVPVAEVVVGGYGHPVPQFAGLEGGLQSAHYLIPIGGIVCAAGNWRRRFATLGLELADPLERDVFPPVDDAGNEASGSVLR
jgi:hypothetical protein